jgi:hypothetical protein
MAHFDFSDDSTEFKQRSVTFIPLLISINRTYMILLLKNLHFFTYALEFYSSKLFTTKIAFFSDSLSESSKIEMLLRYTLMPYVLLPFRTSVIDCLEAASATDKPKCTMTCW